MPAGIEDDALGIDILEQVTKRVGNERRLTRRNRFPPSRPCHGDIVGALPRPDWLLVELGRFINQNFAMILTAVHSPTARSLM